MEQESLKVSKYENEYEKYMSTIPTLPKERGWISEHLVKYQGMWLTPKAGLKGVMLSQNLFTPQPTDLFLATFPKSGTTWFKALIFTILNRNIYSLTDQVQYHPLLNSGPHECVPFLEEIFSDENKMSNLEHLSSPRILATHISYPVLQELGNGTTTSNKVVYVARNPKDVLVSTWEYMRKLRAKMDLQPPLSLEEAYDMFCDGIAHFGPYWDHVLGYYRASLACDQKNDVLFLTYEDMKADPSFWVRRLAEFLDMGFNSEEEKQGLVEKIVTLCSFENLSNTEVNKNGVQKFSSQFWVPNAYFFREGKVGDWKKHLTAEMVMRLDEITEHNFEGSGLRSLWP